MSKANQLHVLIAGAGGYLGTQMTAQFLNQGYRVTALDRYFFGSVFEDLESNPGLIVIKDDIRSCPEAVFKGVDVVINLAAISNDPASELNPRITQDINFRGAVRLAGCAKRNGVKRYILSSSCSVYGQGKAIVDETSPLSPVSEYARSKIQAEKEILALTDETFCTTILRLATLHGLSAKRMRFDLIINIMTLHAWKNNKIYIMGGGKQWRPLLHIDDAIRAFEKVATEPQSSLISGKVFNVGSNTENYQVYQVAYTFRDYFPSLVIEEVPEDADKRTYRVAFDRILSQLGFRPEKNITDSIKDIKHALESGVISDTIKTKTVNYYQYLLEADSLLSTVKLHNRLF